MPLNNVYHYYLGIIDFCIQWTHSNNKFWHNRIPKCTMGMVCNSTLVSLGENHAMQCWHFHAYTIYSHLSQQSALQLLLQRMTQSTCIKLPVALCNNVHFSISISNNKSSIASVLKRANIIARPNESVPIK